MKKVRISKIRPVSWKVYVQGKDETKYVRDLLRNTNIQTGEARQEPGLTDPPVYAFVATSTEETPLTSEELEAILEHHGNVEFEFERH